MVCSPLSVKYCAIEMTTNYYVENKKSTHAKAEKFCRPLGMCDLKMLTLSGNSTSSKSNHQNMPGGGKLTTAFACCRWGRLTHTAMTPAWPSKRPGCAHWARRWWWLARQARCWWCRWSARCARRSCRPSPSTSSATGTTLCGRATRPWRPPSGTCASPPATSPPASCSSTPLPPAPPSPSTPSGSCESGFPPALVVRVPAG